MSENNEDRLLNVEIEIDQEYDNSEEDRIFWLADKPEDFDSIENFEGAEDFIQSTVMFFGDFEGPDGDLLDAEYVSHPSPRPNMIGFRFASELHRDCAQALWHSQMSEGKYDE